MNCKKIFSQLNIAKQCRKYGLPLWQCPQFLFLVMGIIIVGSSLTFYFIGTRYIEDPIFVALITIIIAIVLLIIGTTISRGFERLAEANRMKSEFVSIASHQIRAPLTNLSWTIETLISGKIISPLKKQLEYFKILQENSQRMRDLINDLLVVSRIEQGRFYLKKENISPLKIVEEVMSEFKEAAKSAGVKIFFDKKENPPNVLSDPLQLKQVMGNLLDNAIRYTKKGGEVRIRVGRKNNNIYFEVKDNGVGIPQKDQKYICQKFFRSENILKYQTRGTGLGLYIAKSILGRLGGKIGFKSQEGIGSTFWFTLPTKQ